MALLVLFRVLEFLGTESLVFLFVAEFLLLVHL
jgi:hypothetical protein